MSLEDNAQIKANMNVVHNILNGIKDVVVGSLVPTQNLSLAMVA